MGTTRFISRKDFVPLMEDSHGAWMSNEEKVAAFLPWFTDDPVAEAPLKLIIMLSSCKNLLRLVNKLFKSHADEGTTKIKWKGRKLPRPSNLLSVLMKPVRDRDGRLRDRLPNLKRIDCDYLDTLMDLNGCPSDLEELECGGCKLIQSLAPLAACTNLRELNLELTTVSNLKPLMGCAKLELLNMSNTPVADLSPLSACINIKTLSLSATQVCDLRPLSDLRQLRTLHLGETKVTDLSPLSTLFHLQTLRCSNTEVSDLSPLSKCSELIALDIQYTMVKSLAPLLQCKKLKKLRLSKLKGRTVEETGGYLSMLQEMIPGLMISTW